MIKKIKPKHVLRLLLIISWILFFGICVEAFSYLFNSIYALQFNAQNATYLHLEALYKHDSMQYFGLTLLISLVAFLKAYLFYEIVRILHDKKLDVSKPFNNLVNRFISKVSYLAIIIGLVSYLSVQVVEWISTKGIEMPNIQSLSLGGADVWLFMGITLMVISQLFKRGIEIQTENELTI